MELYSDPSGVMPPGLCAMQQHPYYGDALRALGADVTCLSARKHGVRVAHLQLVKRQFGPVQLRWVPRGPVWAPGASGRDRHHVVDLLHKDAGVAAGSIVSLETPAELPLFAAAGYRALWTCQYVAELCLCDAPEASLAAQLVKWRNRLRHAERSDIEVAHRRFQPGRDNWLLQAETMQRRARRYRALPPAFTKAWARLHPNATRLFLAHRQGRIIAAMLFLRHPPTASYHIGWSDTEGRKYSAHNLLLWRAANWLAVQGCQRLDLGTVDSENAPGLARFKLGSGAALRPLGPTMLRLPGLARRRIAA
ncbi:GNAT family N-acetyltransferase [Roseovarius sp. S88]|uniref:GNAT family N-acetyltransferase n=2 Tax=Roseovarius phycicola TaxID=3080976 RepID=A0ABZ2HFL8_9RHOB